MPESAWPPEREMTGWRLGGTLVLLPENEDDGQDISEGWAHTERRGLQGSRSKMGWRSPSTFSVAPKLNLSKKSLAHKSSFWTKGWKENPVRKLGMAFGDSRSSQEQWITEDKKESRWKEVTHMFHETGLQIQDKVSSQKREDALVQQTAGLLLVTRKDKGTKVASNLGSVAVIRPKWLSSKKKPRRRKTETVS